MHRLHSTALHESVWVSLPGGVGECVIARLDPLAPMLVATAFSAAYMAEIIRGGLQAISKGQYEAALAIGLSRSSATLFVVLPQAMRAAIPALVNQATALLKDTTLFGYIGILELLSVSRSVAANPEWRGTVFELYFFVGAAFWVLCYTMSAMGRRIEHASAPERH